MAGVRDPAFWKRFSTAVHLDEENANTLKHSDSWLARQNRKRSRRTCICWIFWLCFLLLVAAIVGVIVWLVQSDLLASGDGDEDGEDVVSRLVRRSFGGVVGGLR
ncbi:uncharacterized protein LTR77_008622 [Saxophila tyrrhenica]|uniref:Uncharacterized protein n=1 Tax=Saxophila tyrrhenica TaxID=1690608 RepID=A0AAV9P0G7_9PEZI|nr:hypothetical protein LTR77_008622 [Saxophila tyrrhenica]